MRAFWAVGWFVKNRVPQGFPTLPAPSLTPWRLWRKPVRRHIVRAHSHTRQLFRLIAVGQGLFHWIKTTWLLCSLESKRKRRPPWERWSPSTSARQASRWATPAGGCATLSQSVPPCRNMCHPVAICATLSKFFFVILFPLTRELYCLEHGIHPDGSIPAEYQVPKIPEVLLEDSFL